MAICIVCDMHVHIRVHVCMHICVEAKDLCYVFPPLHFIFIRSFISFLFHASETFACTYVCHVYTWWPRDQKKALDPLECSYGWM